MAWESLKAAVEAVITTNGNNEITGQVLRELLTNNIVPQLGAPGEYKGVAIPSTNPGSSDKPIAYFAYTLGTYSNFSGLVVDTPGLYELKNDGSGVWVKTKLLDTSKLFGNLDADGNKISNLDSGQQDGEAIEHGQWEESRVEPVPSKNLFNKEANIVDGEYVNSATYLINSATNWGRSTFISVKENTDYKVTNPDYSVPPLIYYDANKVKISGESANQFTTPAGCAYVIMSLYRDTTKASFGDGSNVQIEEGTVATAVEPYSVTLNKGGNPVKINAQNIIGTILESQLDPTVKANILSEIANILSEIATSTASKNLFDEAAIVDGEYLNSTNGSILQAAGWGRSDYIPVTEGLQYTLSGDRGRIGLAFFAAQDGNALAGSYTSAANPVTVTAPVGANYFAFNVYYPTDPDYFELQFEEGSSATSYEPFEDLYKINPDALPETTQDYKMSLDIDFTGATETIIEAKANDADYKFNVVPFRPLLPDASTVFDLRKTYVNDILVHSMGDEASPYRVLGTTIGANHGYNKTRITSAGHGKTYVDVGSIWTDGSAQWVIVGIPNADTIDVSARTSNSGLTANSITHVSGATNTSAIDSSVKSNRQMYPSIKNRSIKVYFDGVEILTNGVYTGSEKIVFKETYDIMEKNSMMEWLITQVGTATEILQFDGTSAIRVSISYTYNNAGAMTIYTDFLVLENIADFNDIMFNMNNKIETPYSLYIPKTLPFTHESVAYDFTNLTDITTPVLTSRIDITPARAEPTGIFVDRALMIRNDIGFAIGYLPVQDSEIARRRVVAPNKAMQVSESKKLYMSCIDGFASSLNKGDYFSTIAYKAYFPMDAARTAKYIIPTNDAYYLYLDWHVTGIDSVELPNELSGIPYTLIEKSDTVTILSGENTGILTFEIDNSDNYGYCILKFNK